MKTNISLFLLISLNLLACNADPKHPQALLNTAVIETEQSILAFADTADMRREIAEHQSSIIYQTGENSLYADKYSLNGSPLVYIAHAINPGLSERTTSYYFKNDSLVLVKDHIKRIKNPVPVFEEQRSYIRKGVPFKTERRLAVSHSELQKALFKEITSAETVDYAAAISGLDEALTGSNQFEMAFDELINTQEGQFISLKSNLPGNYTASIRVPTPDSFTDSLAQYPNSFKNTKLQIRTRIENKESIYVPAARSLTSASGLNK